MSVNPEFVERCQIEYQRNPRSRIFAPLAEAYRQMGLLDEALRICKLGVKLNPEFAGGFVAYANVLIERKAFETALAQLERATSLSPDNLLAHRLMGETLLELRRPNEALKAFKMVLFLSPDDRRAQAAVKKWEFLTADEYSDDLFAMKPVFESGPKTRSGRDDQANFDEKALDDGDQNLRENAHENPQRAKRIERALSLIDAFTIREDWNAALDLVRDAQRALGPSTALNRREELLLKRTSRASSEVSDAASSSGQNADLGARPALDGRPAPSVQRMPGARERKRQKLERLLRRINTRAKA